MRSETDKKRRGMPLPPWSVVLLLCLTIGLAPFRPPHVVEKLGMLLEGGLKRPLDVLDLLLHGAPWLLALLKTGSLLTPRARGKGTREAG